MDIFNVIENCLVAVKKHPIFLLPALAIFIIGIILGLASSAIVFTHVASSVLPGQGVLPAVLASLPLIIVCLIITGVISFIAGIYIKGTYIDLAHSWKAKKVVLSRSFEVSWIRYKELFEYELIVMIINVAIAAILFGPLIYVSLGAIFIPYLNNTPISRAVSISFLTLSILVGAIYLIASAIVAILFSMGSPIVVLDKKSPMEAIHQAIAIGKKDALSLLGLFILEGIVIVVLIVVAELLGLIPFIGFILAAIMYLVVTTFGELVVPMYYVTYYKKPAPRGMHRQAAIELSA